MPQPALHLAALAASLDAGTGGAPATITLVPDGTFRAIDGRPEGLAGWYLDAPIAADLLARVQARKTRLVINYEHPEANGNPLPAAGWVDRAAIRYAPGVGLTAPVAWTARAKAMIEAQEYAYLSPVIAYDPKSGAVRDLIYAGLTNTPALDGLAPLARLAAHYGYTFPVGQPAPGNAPETSLEDRMDLALSAVPAQAGALRALLGLAEDADAAAIEQAIAKLKADAEQLAPLTRSLDGAVAKSRDGGAAPDSAALHPGYPATAPDPTEWVPMAVHQEAVAALRASAQAGADLELGRLIEEGLTQGKIPGQATAAWLRAQGLTATRAYLEGAPAIAALTRTQTGGQAPEAAKREDEFTAELKAEFGDEATWKAYLAAVADGRVKINTGTQQ